MRTPPPDRQLKSPHRRDRAVEGSPEAPACPPSGEGPWGVASVCSGACHGNRRLVVQQQEFTPRGPEAGSPISGAGAFGFWWGPLPGVRTAAFSLCPPVADSARDSRLSGVSSDKGTDPLIGTPPAGPHGTRDSPHGPISKYHPIRGQGSNTGPWQGAPFSLRQALFVRTLVFRQRARYSSAHAGGQAINFASGNPFLTSSVLIN